MINKLRIVEKEKEQLEGKKLEAEAYMTKQAECTGQRIMGHKINAHKAQVGAWRLAPQAVQGPAPQAPGPW
jgi:hypothetical protein